jgi:hypothetical protein
MYAFIYADPDQPADVPAHRCCPLRGTILAARSPVYRDLTREERVVGYRKPNDGRYRIKRIRRRISEVG